MREQEFVRIRITLPEERISALKAEGAVTGKSISQLIAEAVEWHFNREEPRAAQT